MPIFFLTMNLRDEAEAMLKQIKRAIDSLNPENHKEYDKQLSREDVWGIFWVIIGISVIFCIVIGLFWFFWGLWNAGNSIVEFIGDITKKVIENIGNIALFLLGIAVLITILNAAYHYLEENWKELLMKMWLIFLIITCLFFILKFYNGNCDQCLW